MTRRAVRIDDFANRDILEDIQVGLHKAALLKAALELEIFTRIAEGKRTLSAIAKSGGVDERGAQALLHALGFMGLLVNEQNEYRLTPTAETYLVKGKATYLGNAWLGELAWDVRGDLARALRTGKAPLANPFGDAYEPIRAERAASGLADWERQLEWANQFWDKIEIPREGKKTVRGLVAGESGILPLALAKRWSGFRVTVIERAMALPFTRQLAEKMGVGSQVTFQARSALNLDNLNETYDLIFLDNLAQYASPPENLGLFRKAYQLLALDGQLILRSMVADDDLRGEVALMGVEVFLRGAEGNVYPYVEYRGMLEAAGFAQVEQLKDDWGLIVARKSGTAAKKDKGAR